MNESGGVYVIDPPENPSSTMQKLEIGLPQTPQVNLESKELSLFNY